MEVQNISKSVFLRFNRKKMEQKIENFHSIRINAKICENFERKKISAKFLKIYFEEKKEKKKWKK